eukprot:CAMPEP_0194433990 /NCGR_PEP_ID=MMETSP0176-20130528/80422_1 /TAXON_ID=216777 /ORGANISM="Proboscia alata, Strain PI-D3" /LENGTH=324 /DNA_ID=CAMNT_0039251847 /DNA_START=1 /DNA_END=972 /DNA_ORIENTATION=+
MSSQKKLFALSLLFYESVALKSQPTLNFFKNDFMYPRTSYSVRLSMTEAETKVDENVADEQTRLLNEILGLTESFENVQSNIASSAKLYESKIRSYKSQIEELKSQIKRIDEEERQTQQQEKTRSTEIAATAATDADYVAQIKVLTDEVSFLKDCSQKLITEAKSEILLENLLSIREKDDEIVRLTAGMSKELLGRDKDIVRLGTEIEAAKLRQAENEVKIRDECRKESSKEQEMDDIRWTAEKESLLRRLQSLQDEIEGVKLRTKRELMAARTNPFQDLDQTPQNVNEELEGVVQKLQQKVVQYESERDSLRKLSVLGIKRVW